MTLFDSLNSLSILSKTLFDSLNDSLWLSINPYLLPPTGGFSFTFTVSFII